MRVILKADVESLGKTGDLIKVSDGYARNFLIPRGFAAEASTTNVKALENQKAIITRKAEKERKKAEELLAGLAEVSLVVARKVGAQDKLFGSVTTKDIETELAAKGFQIDRKHIVLADTVKSVGEYPVKIKLHPGVTAEIVLKVVEEN